MKFVLICTVAIAAFAFTSFAPEDDYRFKGMTVEEWAATFLMPSEQEWVGYQLPYGDDSFSPVDWRSNDCISPIRDQGSCGSCWAHATSEMSSDRWCLETGETHIFSPQYLMDCDNSSAFGCGGAATQTVVDWIKDHGIAEDTCEPYTARQGTCSHKCADGSAEKLFHFASDKVWTNSAAAPSTVQIANLKEALTTGPVYFSMQVPSDFMSYRSGVFRTKVGGSVGGHAVECVGWDYDTDSSMTGPANEHWICKNSWNTNWGESGYFRIGMDQTIGYNAGYVYDAVTATEMTE